MIHNSATHSSLESSVINQLNNSRSIIFVLPKAPRFNCTQLCLHPIAFVVVATIAFDLHTFITRTHKSYLTLSLSLTNVTLRCVAVSIYSAWLTHVHSRVVHSLILHTTTVVAVTTVQLHRVQRLSYTQVMVSEIVLKVKLHIHFR